MWNASLSFNLMCVNVGRGSGERDTRIFKVQDASKLETLWLWQGLTWMAGRRSAVGGRWPVV